ncbi:helix-turn-helix domain-containing protein [Bacillus sp. WLY-B-L8]|uniref:helix-turn-helix domain-containing protein n=1 Tax=Bacillus multifaciens TaxID=3068506 RepID=UPI002741EED5|nr:helix-turn-helix domain-containing protein [Bacillus sp. WLY-B-L8]MDP7978117.1 helix-turn-helix domain-containing protein [Bacillus sp. WLY-B-L8]
MNDINVGEKIAEYRKAQGLNSRELATLVNITPSMLSQIEKGSANPSLQTLKLIAAALNIPMFNFFLEDTNAQSLVVRADQRKKITFPESESLSYELLSPDLSGALELALMTLLPQSASSEKPLEHKGEEIAFVLEGTVTLYLNQETLTLYKGDSVKIPSYMKHKWKNPYKKKAVVIFAITPPTF